MKDLPNPKATSTSSNPTPIKLDWKFIKERFAKDCPEQDFQLLIAQCTTMGLNPLSGDVYFVSNWSKKDNKNIWTLRVSIDAMRKRAQESGEHQATKRQVSPDGKQANVKIWKKGCDIPFEETIELNEFNTHKSLWNKMPQQMLKKCCEATVLRMAWPQKFAGLYINEEMPEIETKPEVEPKPKVTENNTKPPLAENPMVEPGTNDFSPENESKEAKLEQMITPLQRKQIYAMLVEMLANSGIKDVKSDRISAFIRHIFDVKSSTEVTAIIANEAIMTWHGKTKDKELTDSLAIKWLSWKE